MIRISNRLSIQAKRNNMVFNDTTLNAVINVQVNKSLVGLFCINSGCLCDCMLELYPVSTMWSQRF